MHEIWFVHDTQTSAAPRRAALERAGWRVRATPSAAEALSWLQDAKPTLLVLDVLLEGHTGFELCRRIREHHTAAELPVLLGCHVYQDAEHAEEAARVGAQRYVCLPIPPEDLLAHVAALTAHATGIRAA